MRWEAGKIKQTQIWRGERPFSPSMSFRIEKRFTLELTIYSFRQFKLRLFSTTLTELHAMAALAIMGFSRMP